MGSLLARRVVTLQARGIRRRESPELAVAEPKRDPIRECGTCECWERTGRRYGEEVGFCKSFEYTTTRHWDVGTSCRRRIERSPSDRRCLNCKHLDPVHRHNGGKSISKWCTKREHTCDEISACPEFEFA